MTAYEVMIKTNHSIIRGVDFNDAQKAKIARRLRENRATDGRVRTFNDY